MVYLVVVWPYEHKHLNYLGFFDQAIIIIVTVMMVFFTDKVEDAAMKVRAGYAVIFFIFFNVLVNIIFVFYEAVKGAIKAYKWLKNKYDVS